MYQLKDSLFVLQHGSFFVALETIFVAGGTILLSNLIAMIWDCITVACKKPNRVRNTNLSRHMVCYMEPSEKSSWETLWKRPDTFKNILGR